FMDEVADARTLAWSRPDHRLERRPLPGLEHRSILRGGRRFGLRRDLGGFGDLPHHLDDVTVSVEDVQLPIRPVAAAEDLVDARELLLRAEVARVRTQRFH